MDELRGISRQLKKHGFAVDLHSGDGPFRITLDGCPAYISELFQNVLAGISADAIIDANDGKKPAIDITYPRKQASLAAAFLWKIHRTMNNLKVMDAFASCVPVTYQDKSTQVTPFHLIEVNPQWLQDHGCYENEFVLLMCLHRDAAIECCLKTSDGVGYGEFKAANLVKSTLKINDRSRIVLLRYNNIICDNVAVQKVVHIKENIVNLSADAYSRIIPGFDEYQVVHLATGALYTIKTDKIRENRVMADRSIQLSYFQRQILNLDTPVVLFEKYFNAVMGSDCLSDADKVVISECYRSERHFIPENYFDSQAKYRLLKKCGYERLQVIPAIGSYRARRGLHEQLKAWRVGGRKTLSGWGTALGNTGLYRGGQAVFCWLLKKMTDFFIGSSSMTLKCVRPYMIDEDKDIVRMSKDNMSMLGLEETDRVIIRFRSRRIKVKVFRIDSIEQLRETNIIGKDAMIDTLIGIPVHLRRELGIQGLNVGVHVERDTGYLFGKNANKQFLPIIALLFTILGTGGKYLTLAQVGMVSVIALPVVVYVIFSQERSKIK